jgi:hypothetical protein
MDNIRRAHEQNCKLASPLVAPFFHTSLARIDRHEMAPRMTEARNGTPAGTHGLITVRTQAL